MGLIIAVFAAKREKFSDKFSKSVTFVTLFLVVFWPFLEKTRLKTWKV
jgi:hypothetical protein